MRQSNWCHIDWRVRQTRYMNEVGAGKFRRGSRVPGNRACTKCAFQAVIIERKHHETPCHFNVHQILFPAQRTASLRLIGCQELLDAFAPDCMEPKGPAQSNGPRSVSPEPGLGTLLTEPNMHQNHDSRASQHRTTISPGARCTPALLRKKQCLRADVYTSLKSHQTFGPSI
ncbi:hypothetical protein PMIN06_004649 [Paraphaeosphaeria minitans]